MRIWFVWLLGVATAFAAVPPGWVADLPDAAGMVGLPPSEIAVRVDEAGAIRLAGVATVFRVEPDKGAPPGLMDALRAAAPTPAGETRARAYIDRQAAFIGVRQAVWAIDQAGVQHIDLVGGPSGDVGFSLDAIRSDPNLPEPAAPSRPPLVLHLRTDGVWVGRTLGVDVRLPAGPERDRVVDGLLDVERGLHSGDRSVLIVTDDPVPYVEAFRLVAATRARNYPRTLLGGGPPGVLAPSEATPATSDSAPVRPVYIRILPTGTFEIDGPAKRLEASDVVRYLEDCSVEPCVVAAVRADGSALLLGSRPSGSEPTRAWIFGRSVVSAPGFSGSLGAPPFEGTFAPLVRIEGSDAPQDVRSPTIIVVGSPDRQLVDEVIRRHINQIRYCYQRKLKDNPTLGGKLVVAFTIEADGKVGNAGIASSTLGDPDVDQCILGRIRVMQFPLPKSGGRVPMSYPFAFSPE